MSKACFHLFIVFQIVAYSLPVRAMDWVRNCEEPGTINIAYCTSGNPQASVTEILVCKDKYGYYSLFSWDRENNKTSHYGLERSPSDPNTPGYGGDEKGILYIEPIFIHEKRSHLVGHKDWLYIDMVGAEGPFAGHFIDNQPVVCVNGL